MRLVAWRIRNVIVMGKPQIAVGIPPPLLAELNQYVEGVGRGIAEVERKIVALESLVKSK